MRVVLLDNKLEDLSAEHAVARKHNAEFIVLDGSSIEEAEEAARDANVLLSQATSLPVTSTMIRNMRSDGHIIKYGAGYDTVDVEAAVERGIRIANLPDGTTQEVAEHASAMILYLLRRLGGYDNSLRAGEWNPSLDRANVPLFSETTIGFVGFGRIGQTTYRKLRSLGFKFAAHDPYMDASKMPDDVELVDLGHLADICTVLSLHLAATSETIGIIDAEVLRRLGKDGFVVNTSRGAIVNEQDLISALHRGTIAGAALDAYCVEPLPQDSRLFHAPNLLLTPHAAFYSQGSDKRVQKRVSEELDRALSGQALLNPIRESKS